MKKIMFFIFMFILCAFNIKAVCVDDELNDWALNVQLERIEFDKNLPNELNGDKPLEETMNYAYILKLSDYRADVIMKAELKMKDDDGEDFTEEYEWSYIPGHKVWGIANYNAKNSVEYIVKIVGAKNSKCVGETIKTFKHTIEPFNFYLKTEDCEKYPEAPMCAMYKDTSDVSEEEFEKMMKEYEKIHGPQKDKTFLDKLFDYIYQYSVFILVPFVFISLFYILKIKRVQKEESGK